MNLSRVLLSLGIGTLFATGFAGPLSFAGGESSGGGKVAYINRSPIPRLFDFSENGVEQPYVDATSEEDLMGWQDQVLAAIPGLPTDIAKLFVQKMHEITLVYPNLADLWMAELPHYQWNIVVPELITTTDVGTSPVEIGPNLSLQQIAFRDENFGVISINTNVLHLLAEPHPMDAAGLLFHEIIYANQTHIAAARYQPPYWQGQVGRDDWTLITPANPLTDLLNREGSHAARIITALLFQPGSIAAKSGKLLNKLQLVGMDDSSNAVSCYHTYEGPLGLRSLYQRMSKKKLWIAHRRVMANSGYAFMGTGAQASNEFPALSVTRFSKDTENEISPEIQSFIRFISFQLGRAEKGRQVLRSLVYENPEFYSAFGMIDVSAQLKKLRIPIPREQTWLYATLPTLIDGFREVLLDEITKSNGSEAADEVDQAIDWARLGLSKSQ